MKDYFTDHYPETEGPGPGDQCQYIGRHGWYRVLHLANIHYPDDGERLYHPDHQYDEPWYTDVSNSPFSIVTVPPPASITVTAPNGGENWQQGSSPLIQWSYTGDVGSTVRIEPPETAES